MSQAQKIDYEKFVNEALTSPGLISKVYTTFHNYSFTNQWFAKVQLEQVEPINSYAGWQKLGRQVRKGSKAICLRMPVTPKNKETGEIEGMFFMLRNNWFGYSSTDAIPDFIKKEEGVQEKPFIAANLNKDALLSSLGLVEEPFKRLSGNCQGYAKPSDKVLAINPLAENPTKTLFHEIAHCLLHSEEALIEDNASLDSSAREVEAELTAYLVSSIYGASFDSLVYSRGYIQHWLARGDKDKIRFPKVFNAVEKIIKASS